MNATKNISVESQSKALWADHKEEKRCKCCDVPIRARDWKEGVIAYLPFRGLGILGSG